MNAPRTHAVGAVLASALLLASACSTGPDESAPPRPTIKGDVLRNGTTYDYDVAASPSELSGESDLTVSGTVKSWSDGRAFQEGSDLLSRTAVLEIVVDDSDGSVPTPTASPSPDAEPSPQTPAPSASTSSATSSARSIFVEVNRGDIPLQDGREVDQPKGQKTQLSVADLKAAAPIGARVVFMGGAATPDASIKGARVTQSWQPPVAGATLLTPKIQGLLFENADGSYVSAIAEQSDVEGHGWPAAQGEKPAGDEFEELVDEVL